MTQTNTEELDGWELHGFRAEFSDLMKFTSQPGGGGRKFIFLLSCGIKERLLGALEMLGGVTTFTAHC